LIKSAAGDEAKDQVSIRVHILNLNFQFWSHMSHIKQCPR